MPLVCAIFLLIFFRQKVVWWEYIILVVPSILLSTGIYFGMISNSQSDTEYLGDYVTTIRDYDPWNEYIHRTCTTTHSDGKGHSYTTTYDCSYVDLHPRRYTQIFSDGSEHDLGEVEFGRIFKMWSTPYEFVDMHRNFHTIDGDMHQRKWDLNPEHSKTVTFTNSYKNKIKTSRSIFGFSKISKKEAQSLGLYDYPKVEEQSKTSGLFDNDENQSPFLGYKPTKNELIKWQYINGYYGASKQFRAYILFFYNQPESIVEKQRDYWEGGNKNEMIMCFGIDSTTKEVQWFDAFSWCDKPTFEVNFRSYMNEQSNKLDLISLGNWVEKTGISYWKRKEFKDFDYIKIELSGTQLTWLFIIIIMFNIGMSVYVVLNRQTNDNKNSNYKNNRNNWDY